jgi:hypothetical protein
MILRGGALSLPLGPESDTSPDPGGPNRTVMDHAETIGAASAVLHVAAAKVRFGSAADIAKLVELVRLVPGADLARSSARCGRSPINLTADEVARTLNVQGS